MLNLFKKLFKKKRNNLDILMRNTKRDGTEGVKVGINYRGREFILSATQVANISLDRNGYYSISLDRIIFNNKSISDIFGNTSPHYMCGFDFFIRHKTEEQTLFRNCFVSDFSIEYKADDFLTKESFSIHADYMETTEVLSEEEWMVKDIIE